jgi:SAM-dependent methyltransferase
MTMDSMENTPKILDLGCGTRKRPGAIGLDINPLSNADVIHDLSHFPYPFADDSFDEVYADNVLEHLGDVIRTMEELHRICRNGAMVKIIVPYFRSRWAFIDPTHCRFFTVDSFAYFDPDSQISRIYPYSPARFRLEKIVFNENIPSRLGKSVVKWLANRWPSRYERFLGHIVPLDDLSFYLRVLK